MGVEWWDLFAGLAAVIVVSAGMLFVRRSVSGSGMRDFLGITVAFLFLAWLTMAMIVGEYALG
ncbi:MAG: hypothetical protein ACYDGR_02530 [Candidatus Dormibacteria bacterium]